MSGYTFSDHALRRMKERNISEDQVERVFWLGNRSTNREGATEYYLDDFRVVVKDFIILTVMGPKQ